MHRDTSCMDKIRQPFGHISVDRPPVHHVAVASFILMVLLGVQKHIFQTCHAGTTEQEDDGHPGGTQTYLRFNFPGTYHKCTLDLFSTDLATDQQSVTRHNEFNPENGASSAHLQTVFHRESSVLPLVFMFSSYFFKLRCSQGGA